MILTQSEAESLLNIIVRIKKTLSLGRRLPGKNERLLGIVIILFIQNKILYADTERRPIVNLRVGRQSYFFL